MKHAHKLHLGTSLFVALMVIGTAASAFGTQIDFFKGAETQTSVLTATPDEAKSEIVGTPASTDTVAPDFSEIIKENQDRVKESVQITSISSEPEAPLIFTPSPISETPLAPKTPKLPAPTIVIGSQQIAEVDAPKVESNGPAPVIVVPVTEESQLEKPAVQKENVPETCEAKGQFTYTGPDRPGLLYGMCIECQTYEYIMGNGVCAKK